MTSSAIKTQIRAAALASRSAVPHEEKQAFATRLAAVGPELARRHGDAPNLTVAVYHPIRDEVDTLPLLASLAQSGVTTALPVAIGRGQPLRFHLWRAGDPVEPGRWGIPEPLPGAPRADPDVLFVPFAAFDRSGHRLGYGAGFYDNALAALRRLKRVLAIGVGYGVQEVEKVPAEAHDEALDLVITDREVIVCGST